MMENGKKHIIVYTFQSLEDPLIKGLMLQYLLSLVKDTGYVFHLITHEQKVFELTPSQTENRKSELLQDNIYWYPVKYHNGKFLIFKKAFDFLMSALICFRIKRRYKTKVIIGFLPLAAGFSAILAPVLRMKLITYCFEPHSQYMVDFGIWSKKSWKYALLRKYERTQLEISSEIIVPTQHTRIMVEKINPYVRNHVFPISIDTEKNIYDSHFRSEFRKKHLIESKRVILYMGKFGGLYYDIPYFIDFLYGFRAIENYHVLIISSDYEDLKKYISVSAKDDSFFTLLDFIPYDRIHEFISVADIGIVAVPPLPSQKYRTPVKTGLYLSCGIPYIINRNIAEDDLIAETENVGVVVEDFADADLNVLSFRMDALLKDPEIHVRCRNTAIKYRSHQKALEVLQKILKDNYI